MRFLKKLATICMALTMCLGLGMAFTACDDGEASSSEQAVSATYVFSVTKNGAAAVGYGVQLCTKNADGSLGSCLQAVSVGDDGIAKVNVYDASVVYEIHIMKGNDALDKSEYVTQGDIPANYNGGTITVLVND